MLIYPDLSQIEYRLIAHETHDPELIRMFRAKEDIHSNLYNIIFGRMPNDEKERKIAKTARYAEVYEAGFPKFLFLLRLSGVNISAEEGRVVWKKVKGKFPSIDRYKKMLRSRLVPHGGWVRNLFGRMRFFDPSHFVSPNDPHGIERMLREAFNWIFQSSGHDITEMWTMECMMHIRAEVKQAHRIILVDEVHDEFVLDVPGKLVKPTIEVIENVSGNLNTLIQHYFGVQLVVPIIAETDKGDFWK